MNNKLFSIIINFFLIAFVLTACNLPNRQTIPLQTSPVPLTVQSSPTPTPLCANPYFPNVAGDKWEYSGSNTIIGAYTRTDSIANSSTEAFTQDTTLANISYSVPYDCTSIGLISSNPIQQYAGALLSSPDLPVSVKLTSDSGVSLPIKITPGDTWKQTADFEATSQQLNLNGRFVFDYTAVGYENVTVPTGTYNALRVDGIIRIEVTGLHVLAGTYTTTVWLAAEVGIVKSEGTSHVTGIDFTDSMQLTSFTPTP